MKRPSLRRGRELAVQALYERELSGASLKDLTRNIQKTPGPSQEARDLAVAWVEGVLKERETFDAAISSASENWDLARMSAVDRNCLRLACYELMRRSDVPFRVVIDEAIEIAKRYGSEESGAFVNGILNAIAKRLRPEESAIGERDREDPSSVPLE